MTDQSGPFSSLGTDAQVAVELAVEQINERGGVNGTPIELVVVNSPGRDEEAAILGARRLADREDVAVIIGPVSSGEALVAFEQAARAEVPIVTGSVVLDGVTDFGRGWAFRNQATNRQFYGQSLPDFREAYDVSAVALVFDNVTPFAIDAAEALRALAAGEISIVQELTIEPQQEDFSTIVQRIAGLDIDGLLVASGPTEGGGIARELARQGVEVPVLGHPAHNSASFREAAPDDLAGWVVPSIVDPETDDDRAVAFEARMDERDPTPPPQPEAANYYDIVYMIAEVAEDALITTETALADARRAIRDGLLELQDFPGIAGAVTFLANGDTEKPVYTVVFEGDSVRRLE